MNIQIFGTTKCFDTKKAQRYFKERGIKFQMMKKKQTCHPTSCSKRLRAALVS